MVIDRDSSGFLSREEIEEYLKSKMGDKYNQEIVFNIFSIIDSD
jgi:Ca2+-binding EF-hand superfamily protein